MLLNLEVGNFKSFKNNENFSMEANLKDDTLKENIVKISGKNLLKSSLIFGANASGKTNLLKSLNYLKNLVLESKTYNEKEKITKEYFKLDNQFYSKKPFHIKVEFIENKKIYLYEVNLRHEEDNKRYNFIILKEKLDEDGKNVFDRTKDNIEINDNFIQKGDEVIKELAKKINKNNLFLSNLSTKDFSGITSDAFNWFSERLIINIDGAFGKAYTKNMINKDPDFKKFLIKHIKNADLGDIKTIKLKENPEGLDKGLAEFLKENKDISEERKEKIVQNHILEIKTYHPDSSGRQIEFDFNEEESQGTQNFINYLGPIYDIIKRNRVFFVDELEQNLHPTLLKYLINILSEEKTNSQIICASHCYPLLLYVNSHDESFRRDQIWFTNMRKDNSTELYSLLNIGGIRKDLKIFKAYFEGRFEAFPDVDE